MTATRNAQETLKIKSIIKETIQELLADDEFVNKIIKKLSDKYDDKIQKMEDTIKTIEQKTIGLEKQIDTLKQNEKINNICVYGIQEQQNEKLETLATQLINAHTEINLNERDINKCYRVGKQNNNSMKSRPVIIQFKFYEHKLTVLKNAKNFKGKKIFITEDLTQNRLKLLQDAKSKLGVKNVWSYNGNIFVKVNGSSVKIRNNEDLLIHLQN